jgi:hypothetical protein
MSSTERHHAAFFLAHPADESVSRRFGRKSVPECEGERTLSHAALRGAGLHQPTTPRMWVQRRSRFRATTRSAHISFFLICQAAERQNEAE